MQGPILDAIDAGHIDHDGKCAVCKVPWSQCQVIVTARAEQRNYAENLRLQRLVGPDTRKTYI